MKKYLTVVLTLFFASVLTIIVLASRKETFMREVRIIDHSLNKPTPFPLTEEKWPAQAGSEHQRGQYGFGQIWTRCRISLCQGGE